MSSLHDPFDLLKTGQEMDNIVPFLAPTKINQMIDTALAQPQIPAKAVRTPKFWKFGGMAIAASLALFMVFLTPESQPVTQKIEHTSISSAATEDVGEFSELVMLDTWEKY